MYFLKDGSIRHQNNLWRLINYPLLLNNTATDYGVLELEGISFNWKTKTLAVCGGKQVNQISDG
jgi:hypothetical protein